MSTPLPVRPLDEICGFQQQDDILFCSAVQCAPVVDHGVGDDDVAKDDLLICGRCKPVPGDEPLVQPRPLVSPKAPSAAERAIHELTPAIVFGVPRMCCKKASDCTS